YCSSESNSKFQVELAKVAAEKLGMECVDATVSSSNEIQQVVESLIGKVDAIYAPTDNMIAAGMATVNMVAEPAKIPVIVGEEGMCKSGGLATYGINYYNLGKLTANQAVKILKDGAKTAEMPIEYLTDCDLIINKTIADKLGVVVSAELSNKATFVEMK
ncbi:MAG: ABC transporter substrate-binding protein, partial [Oscillospiraceae bacterium]